MKYLMLISSIIKLMINLIYNIIVSVH